MGVNAQVQGSDFAPNSIDNERELHRILFSHESNNTVKKKQKQTV